jgi:hypothetical protein
VEASSACGAAELLTTTPKNLARPSVPDIRQLLRTQALAELGQVETAGGDRDVLRLVDPFGQSGESGRPGVLCRRAPPTSCPGFDGCRRFPGKRRMTTVRSQPSAIPGS